MLIWVPYVVKVVGIALVVFGGGSVLVRLTESLHAKEHRNILGPILAVLTGLIVWQVAFPLIFYAVQAEVRW